jgi:KTSC domain
MAISPQLIRAAGRLAAARSARRDVGWAEALGEHSQSVNSSAISRVGYNEQDQTLTVTFLQSGRTYTYYDVPITIYRGIVRASSPGRYFNFNVKNRYSFS